jgi:hypothetical protein
VVWSPIVVPSQLRRCCLPPSSARPVFLERLLGMSLDDDGFACRLCENRRQRRRAAGRRTLGNRSLAAYLWSGLGGLPLMQVEQRRHAVLLQVCKPVSECGRPAPSSESRKPSHFIRPWAVHACSAASHFGRLQPALWCQDGVTLDADGADCGLLLRSAGFCSPRRHLMI